MYIYIYIYIFTVCILVVVSISSMIGVTEAMKMVAPMRILIKTIAASILSLFWSSEYAQSTY